jgi:hypothetical protein
MAVEAVISRVSRSLVAMGAFGASSYVRRHPERARERLVELRGVLLNRGDSRVQYVDRILCLLDRAGGPNV